MKKHIRLFVMMIILATQACQTITPTPPTREGKAITDCTYLVHAVKEIQPMDIPQQLMETGTKAGDEFDANDYFDVFENLTMQDGYVLDYAYSVGELRASPELSARPANQPAYKSINDIPPSTAPGKYPYGEYLNFIEVNDTEQGYFEYVVMSIMATQFYLFWHAAYNDTQIVCDQTAANMIVTTVNSQDFGAKFDLEQQIKIRTMKNIEPLVTLTDYYAIVDVVIFTNQGGFFRYTYTISRWFPHTIKRREENLVPYDSEIVY